VTNSDGVNLLATTAGVAAVVVVVMNALRMAVDSTWFDRWAPLLSMVIGVVLAVAFALATIQPLTGTALLGGIVVGCIAGGLSQNANTVLQRAFKGADK
jgi:hypothetical protein